MVNFSNEYPSIYRVYDAAVSSREHDPRLSEYLFAGLLDLFTELGLTPLEIAAQYALADEARMIGEAESLLHD